ncbi:hypothetical protein CTAYLR_005694 [Chrysophaeum taylorii]|uniref:Bacterial bifunctional deaminase-reductase C-terminal domain-containing protein n=1 Tax=Chrysophaeum taylorii TaxID=2483200 RepID=A0AAD7UCK9_9STRA|nr:hypothetical protein CTAYLR_005694 [Chrysophaeum taylorii]
MEALVARIRERARGREPYVIVTYAQSLDGSIGTVGDRLLLSGEASTALTHALRRECDAIAVGVGTALADDPRLTVRVPNEPPNQPAAIVFDSNGRLPPNARLFGSGRRVVVFTARPLALPGTEVVVVPADPGGLDLRAAIEALGRMGIRSIMVEGGARIIESFVAAGLADDLLVTVAPRLVGGIRPQFQGSRHIHDPVYLPLGQDFVVYGQLRSRRR